MNRKRLLLALLLGGLLPQVAYSDTCGNLNEILILSPPTVTVDGVPLTAGDPQPTMPAQLCVQAAYGGGVNVYDCANGPYSYGSDFFGGPQ